MEESRTFTNGTSWRGVPVLPRLQLIFNVEEERFVKASCRGGRLEFFI